MTTRLTPILTALVIATASAQAANQDWRITHQPDRFMDRIMMEAYADADTGPGRMMLYCDTESGFRVMFLPHRALVPEGPLKASFIIDGANAVTLNANAYGDDETDVVTVYETAKIQRALSTAHHVRVHFSGNGRGSADDAFTFANLAKERATLMKVCPLAP